MRPARAMPQKTKPMKKELAELQKYYGNDHKLGEFRQISDMDFGRITEESEAIENLGIAQQ